MVVVETRQRVDNTLGKEGVTTISYHVNSKTVRSESYCPQICLLFEHNIENVFPLASACLC